MECDREVVRFEMFGSPTVTVRVMAVVTA